MMTTKKKKLIRNLKSRYRLVIMNDETLEEKASFNLRPMMVFVGLGMLIILLITLTTFLIAFTGLREYIPGYADLQTKKHVHNLVLQADSIERSLKSTDIYLANLRNVINGNISADTTSPVSTPVRTDTISRLEKSKADEELRREIESDDRYALSMRDDAALKSSISGFLFFPPVQGTVTSKFDPVTKHLGIDIASNPNEAIKATLDGTVLISNFTSETGYVIGIQHSNNLFSFYKHNSALLKKAGDFVKAGDVVAIIGNSGEFSEGPHLHFELWFNGTAVDPQRYISF